MTRLGGWTIEEFDAVTSTNEVARRAVAADAPDHSVYVAARQTAGRGRGDRAWASPPGGLYASLVLRDLDERLAPLLPLVAGEALRRAVAEAAPDVQAWLKWPNDLMAARRGDPEPAGKLGGVLVESASSGKGLDWAIVGIGVNVATDPAEFPRDIDPPAVSLASWTATTPSTDQLLDLLLDQANQCLFSCGADVASFVADVERHLAYRDQAVRIEHAEAGAPGWQGTLRGIAPSGALRLQVDGDEHLVAPWNAGRLRPVA